MPIDPLLTAPHDAPAEPWCTAADLTDAGVDLVGVDAGAVDRAIRLSSRVLWARSGRRYGLRSRVVRPCFNGSHSSWSNGVCGCWLPSLELPGPIASVAEVIIDGVVVPLASLRIKTSKPGARRVLLRVDGDTWPCCNDLGEDPTVVAVRGCPAWQITYWQGRPVPPLGRDAAAALAGQHLRAAPGGADCVDGIQPGLSRISRRGVTIEYETGGDSTGDAGFTAAEALVKDWLASVNPHRLQQGPSVLSARRGPRVWEWVDAGIEAAP